MLHFQFLIILYCFRIVWKENVCPDDLWKCIQVRTKENGKSWNDTDLEKDIWIRKKQINTDPASNEKCNSQGIRNIHSAIVKPDFFFVFQTTTGAISVRFSNIFHGIGVRNEKISFLTSGAFHLENAIQLWPFTKQHASFIFNNTQS